jgi:hypothetical protein
MMKAKQSQIPKDLNPQRILIPPWSTVYGVHFYSLPKITNNTGPGTERVPTQHHIKYTNTDRIILNRNKDWNWQNCPASSHFLSYWIKLNLWIRKASWLDSLEVHSPSEGCRNSTLGRDPGFDNPRVTRFKPGVTETGFINCYVMRSEAVNIRSLHFLKWAKLQQWKASELLRWKRK